MNIRSFARRTVEIFFMLLCDVTLQAHFVQRPFVLPCHGLHDGCQERLWVEQAAQPDAVRKLEVGGPGLELLRCCNIKSNILAITE